MAFSGEVCWIGKFKGDASAMRQRPAERSRIECIVTERIVEQKNVVKRAQRKRSYINESSVEEGDRIYMYWGLTLSLATKDRNLGDVRCGSTHRHGLRHGAV